MKVIIACAALSALAIPAQADCTGFEVDFDPGAVLIGTVTSKKAIFHDDAMQPTAAYVVKGDEVLAQSPEDGWVCASYISKRGVETIGFLKASDLTVAPATEPALADWLGNWTTGKWQNLTLKQGSKSGWIDVSGTAYWAMSEETALTGGLNIGGVAGEGPLENGRVGFTQTEDGSFRPYSEAARDAFECAILVKVLSRTYLMAEDSGNCGGHNVRFTGIYARGKVKGFDE